MNIVFDIETAPNERAETYLKEVKTYKAKGTLKDPDKIAKDLAIKRSEAAQKVSLNPRGAKVISIGYQLLRGYEPVGEPKALYGDDETRLLRDFADLVINAEYNGDVHLHAYNGDSFDFPFLRCRYMFNNLGVPEMLTNRYRCHDLMKAFAMDWGDKISLNEIAWACEIPGKTDDAKKIKQWHEEGNWEKIVELNLGDVEAETQLFLRTKPYGNKSLERYNLGE